MNTTMNDPSTEERDRRVRAMASILHEPKAGLLIKLADVIGMEQMEELFQRTLDVEAAGGMPTSSGGRRRTPGGVFFQLTKAILPANQRRKIFRERRPKPEGTSPLPPQALPKPPPTPLQPPTLETAMALLRATTTIPVAKKGQAIVKVTVIGRPKQVKKLDTCVLVVLAPKAPGTLPKGLPPMPDLSTATLAIFVANKQWNKAEEALRQDAEDELIIEGFPANDAKNQLTAIWAQSCTTKGLQRALRAQKSQE